MSQLSKRVVLISGGASGIGAVIARAFLGAGDDVHVADNSPATVERFLAENPAASATIADVSKPADVDRVFSALNEDHGRLDILINNAGIAGPTAAVQDISDEDWDRCIAVDLNSVFYMTRRAIQLLQQSHFASIINIASTAALHGYPMRSPYAASKWAQIGLTKTWAMELGPSGIRVNAICPGSVEGERIDSVIERAAERQGVSASRIRELYLQQTSMRTFATADDIAAMAVFLASDVAGRISGQVIAVDGHTESLSNPLT